MIQRFLAPVLRHSGMVAAARNSSWRRDRLAILCYHSFSGSDEHVWDSSLYMTPRALEERFELLREGRYRVLPLGEAVSRLYAGTLPERSVAITFDDGTRDFATTAVPLLERFGFPATVYLSTWYCNQPRPVFRVFAKYILWKGRHNYKGGPLGGVTGNVDVESPEGRTRFVDEVRARVKREGITLEQRDRILAGIAGSLGVDYEKALAETNFKLMTAEQVAQVSRSPLVSVELHTHRHQTPLNEELFQREIRQNRERIEAMTGRTPKHFCYPSGVFDGQFLPWLRSLGVETATTGEAGLAGRDSNPLLLPRVVDTSNLTADRFAVWVSGVGHFLRNRRRVGAQATESGEAK